MRHFLLTLLASLLLAPFSAKTQQVMLNSGSGGLLTLNNTGAIAPGVNLSVGRVLSPPTYIMEGLLMFESPDSIWAKTVGAGISLEAFGLAPNGDILVTGSYDFVDGFVARLDPDGDLIWGRILATSEYDQFTTIAATDSFVYVAGVHAVQTSSQAITLKLDALGNLVWALQQSYDLADLTSSSVSQLKILGDSLIIFGAEVVETTDISIRILERQNGQEIMHRTYGDTLSENDDDPDVALLNSGEFLVSMTGSSGLSLKIGLMRLSDAFDLTGSSMTYEMPGYEIARSSLAVSGNGAYLSSQVANASADYAHLMKADLGTLDVLWNKTLFTGAFPSGLTIDDSVSVMSTALFTGVLSVVDTSLGSMAYPCDGPEQLEFTALPYPNLGQRSHAIQPWNPILFTVTDLPGSDDHLIDEQSCVPVILPIELISFTAKANGRNVLLEWSTASEQNNDFFVVERSTDGGFEFESILRQEGMGDSQTRTDYSDVDKDPATGMNYYRLQQTDLDGTTTVSEVVAAFVDEAPILTAYPNPARPGEEIRFRGSFEILDISGRFVKRATDITSLESGVYVFRSLAGSVRVVVN